MMEISFYTHQPLSMVLTSSSKKKKKKTDNKTETLIVNPTQEKPWEDYRTVLKVTLQPPAARGQIASLSLSYFHSFHLLVCETLRSHLNAKYTFKTWQLSLFSLIFQRFSLNNNVDRSKPERRVELPKPFGFDRLGWIFMLAAFLLRAFSSPLLSLFFIFRSESCGRSSEQKQPPLSLNDHPQHTRRCIREQTPDFVVSACFCPRDACPLWAIVWCLMKVHQWAWKRFLLVCWSGQNAERVCDLRCASALQWLHFSYASVII